jgi:hypothetical protein
MVLSQLLARSLFLVLSKCLARSSTVVLSSQMARSLTVVLSFDMARSQTYGAITSFGPAHHIWCCPYSWPAPLIWFLLPVRLAPIPWILPLALARSTFLVRSGDLACSPCFNPRVGNGCAPKGWCSRRLWPAQYRWCCLFPRPAHHLWCCPYSWPASFFWSYRLT